LTYFKIKKGLDIPISGKPELSIKEWDQPRQFAVYPSEFEGVKPRLKVAVGDTVRRGGILFENRKNERMLFRSPCSGKIKEIRLGARRAPREIIIERSETDEAETFGALMPENASRDELVSHLLCTGLWPLIKQRPFSKIADPEAEPKAVLVNAMNSAPFQADFRVVLKNDEKYFLTGLQAVEKLTEGKVHVCTAPGTELPDLGNAQQHTFDGPYPAGNTSVHINRICPIQPYDTVYTLRAQDVILIGKLLLTGELPRTKVIALGGPSVKEEYRKHYRVHIGASLQTLFEEALENDREHRIIAGSVLYGDKVHADSGVRYYGSEFFVLEEDRSRHVLGWTMPGLNQYSAHRVTLASFFGRKRQWNLGTNLHGAKRAMVVTGWMDKYQPLNIMTDFLIRACLAHDTDEMIQLGILETDPEDFAIASFVDPHKTDVCGIIKRGLEEIEKEGI